MQLLVNLHAQNGPLGRKDKLPVPTRPPAPTQLVRPPHLPIPLPTRAHTRSRHATLTADACPDPASIPIDTPLPLCPVHACVGVPARPLSASALLWLSVDSCPVCVRCTPSWMRSAVRCFSLLLLLYCLHHRDVHLVVALRHSREHESRSHALGPDGVRHPEVRGSEDAPRHERDGREQCSHGTEQRSEERGQERHHVEIEEYLREHPLRNPTFDKRNRGCERAQVDECRVEVDEIRLPVRVRAKNQQHAGISCDERRDDSRIDGRGEDVGDDESGGVGLEEQKEAVPPPAMTVRIEETLHSVAQALPDDPLDLGMLCLFSLPVTSFPDDFVCGVPVPDACKPRGATHA
mmetsp:Transcript_28200/g.56928  ORF Transcript_28200/g.56928 Transcript_28200/m.56928 type:complete len:349 (+) Transcript_28200:330-1376(+)